MTRLSLRFLFGIFCIVPLLGSWHAIGTTFGLALQDNAYTHILLIIPISLVLIFIEPIWGKSFPAPSFGAGSAILVIAVLVAIGARAFWTSGMLTSDVHLAVEMLAVVLWWVGSFLFCFGWRISRKCAFPLLFLLWLIPIPASGVNHITQFLQLGSASAARFLLAIFGIPVAQENTILKLPALTIEVAKECSSIRSSLMLVVTSMVMAHVLLRSLWGKTLVSVAAIPLSIAKNGLRIFTLTALGVYVDPGFLTGRLHRHGGIVFFLISLLAVVVMICLVDRLERRTGKGPRRKEFPDVGRFAVKQESIS